MALNGPELCRMTFNTAYEGFIFQMVNGMNGPECCDCCEWLLNPPFDLDQEASDFFIALIILVSKTDS